MLIPRVRHWAVQVAVLFSGGYIGIWVMAVAAPQGEGEGKAGEGHSHLVMRDR